MANLQGYELTVTGRALLAKAGTGAFYKGKTWCR